MAPNCGMATIELNARRTYLTLILFVWTTAGRYMAGVVQISIKKPNRIKSVSRIKKLPKCRILSPASMSQKQKYVS